MGLDSGLNKLYVEREKDVSVEALKIIVEHFLRISWVDNEPELRWRDGALEESVREENLELFKVLLQDPRTEPYDIGYSNNPLLLAARNGQDEMVQLLLEDGRSIPSYDKNYALKWAVSSNHVNIVEMLMADDRLNLTRAVYEDILGYAEKNNGSQMISVIKNYKPLSLE